MTLKSHKTIHKALPVSYWKSILWFFFNHDHDHFPTFKVAYVCVLAKCCLQWWKARSVLTLVLLLFHCCRTVFLAPRALLLHPLLLDWGKIGCYSDSPSPLFLIIYYFFALFHGSLGQYSCTEKEITCSEGPPVWIEPWAAAARTQPLNIGHTLQETEPLGHT